MSKKIKNNAIVTLGTYVSKSEYGSDGENYWYYNLYTSMFAATWFEVKIQDKKTKEIWASFYVLYCMPKK